MLNCGWYADEEVCRKTGVPAWVKRQRRIGKRLGELEWRGGYFNLEMLKRRLRVTDGLRGLDPDKDGEGQLERWLESHQGTKPLTEEKRAEMSAWGKKMYASNLGPEQKEGSLRPGFEG